LEEIKHFLRITSDIDDKVIITLLETALFHLEKYMSQSLIQKTYFQEIIQSDEEIRLENSPVVQILSVKLKDETPVHYYSDNGFLVLTEKHEGPVIVQYVAGLFRGFLPSIFKFALLEIISYLYHSDHTKTPLDSVLNQFNFLKKYKL
jgi:hypothetical protein